jgi:hypothetical protein
VSLVTGLVPEPTGANYVRSALTAGLSLGQRVSGRAGELPSVYALTAAEQAAERLASLEVGGLPGGSVKASALARWLRDRWPAAVVIVAVPLARPDDLALRASNQMFRTCANEVYAVADASADLDAVERALRATDPATGYVVVVADAEGHPGVNECPTDAFDQGSMTLRGVLVGAYDGEGYAVFDYLESE